MNNQVIQKITDIPLFFFIGLYFLIFICYINSYYYSLHFLFTFEVSYAGSVFGKFLFLVFIVLYLLNQNTGKIIYSALTNLSFLTLVSSLGLKLDNFTRKHPFLSFYLVYIYALLFILHRFMLLFTEIDLGVEFLYHCFNLIRLFCFPLIITAYVATYGPRLYVVDVNLSLEDFKNIVKNIYSFTTKAYAQAPRPVKVGTAVLGTAAALKGGAMLHGSAVRAKVYETVKAPVIEGQFQALKSHACLQDEKCQQLVQETIRYFAKLNGSTTDISVDDLQAVLKNEPTYLQKLHYFLDVLPTVNKDAYLRLLEKQAAQLEQSSSSTSQFNKAQSVSEKKISQSEQIDIKPVSETGVDVLPDKNLVPLSKPHNPNSPLEELWSLFT